MSESSGTYGHIPRWDGTPETLDDFEDRVRDWVLGYKEEDRKLLGPRLRQVMPASPQQHEEAKTVPQAELTAADGALSVVATIRKARGASSLQEAVSLAKNLWKGLWREKAEGMRAWCSRFHCTCASAAGHCTQRYPISLRTTGCTRCYRGSTC